MAPRLQYVTDAARRFADELSKPTDVPLVRRRDWALGATLVLLHLSEMGDANPSWALITTASGSLACVLAVVRNRFGLTAVMIAFGSQSVVDIAAGFKDVSILVSFGHFTALTLLAYALARWGELRGSAIALGLIAIVAIVGEVFVPDGQTTAEIATSAVWLAAAAIGLAMRYRARIGGYRRAETRHEERERLARELHDVVAHHVSAIAIQAQAAQTVVLTSPETAARALDEIHTSASSALTEMRHMVALLRDPDRARELDPRPRLEELRGLAADAELGLEVVVEIEQDEASMPASAVAAIHRIAQEALTNTRKHGRDATAVVIRVVSGHDTVTLTISDNGSITGALGQAEGYGLIGMAERVRILGGSFTAGPGVGGWTVSATIPIGASS